jgi:hypothetical protein
MINELTLENCLFDNWYYGKAEFQMTCSIDDLRLLEKQNIYYVDFDIPSVKSDTIFDVFKRTYETPEGKKGIQFDLIDTSSEWLFSGVSCDPHFIDLLVAFSKY